MHFQSAKLFYNCASSLSSELIRGNNCIAWQIDDGLIRLHVCSYVCLVKLITICAQNGAKTSFFVILKKIV